MNTNIIRDNGIDAVTSNIDPELGIDVGATYKDFLRDQRIEKILATGSRRSRKARGSSRPHNMTVRVSRSNGNDFVPSIPAGCNADDIIPGTTWTWGDALSESRDCMREHSRRRAA
ncbi:MAG: hypothetical protein JST01_03415 [Cyanobacteria bacterium SZAS TMP-1]|nr:hypothetical protein [Cyanobacteria bacterium SZAS TMP-1]